MNYREMLDKFGALEDELWRLSQRVNQLERDRSMYIPPVQVPNNPVPAWTVTS